MSVIGSLAVELSMDSSGMDSEIKSSKAKLNGFAKSLGNIGTKLTTSLTLPIAGAFAFGVKAASDLNEATDAATITFGDFSQQVIDGSKKSATQLGLSSAAFLTYSTQLGVFAQNAGLSGQSMVDFSNSTLKASTDLASFYNKSPEEAMEKITAAIRGEYDGLDELGIIMNEASVNQYAWTHGIAKNGEELTEQQKIMARQGAILEQYNNGPAKDNFEISDGLAKQTAIFRAQLTDTGAVMGEVLIPYAIKLAKGLSKLMVWIQKLSPQQKKWAAIIALVAASIGPVLIAIGAMIPAIGALGTAFAILTGPIGLVVLAIAALAIAYKTNFLGFGDAVNSAAKHLVEFGKAVMEFMPQLVSAIKTGIAPFKGIFDAMVLQLKGFITILQGIFQGDFGKVLDGLKMVIKGYVGVLKAEAKLLILGITKGAAAAWPYVVKFIKNIPGWVKSALGSLSETLKEHGTKLIQGLRQGAADYWESTLKPFVQGLPNKIMHAINDLMAPAAALVDAGIALIKGLYKAASGYWTDTVKPFIQGIPGAAKDLADAINKTVIEEALKSLGAKIVGGLKTGMTNVWNAAEGGVAGFIAGIPAGIASFAKGIASAAEGALSDTGYKIASGLITGINNRWGDVTSFARSLASEVWDILMTPLNLFNSIPGMPDVPIPSFPWSAAPPPQTGPRSVSPMSTATGSPTVINHFHIDGYNKNPDELANTVATTLSRELRLAGGFS